MDARRNLVIVGWKFNCVTPSPGSFFRRWSFGLFGFIWLAEIPLPEDPKPPENISFPEAGAGVFHPDPPQPPPLLLEVVVEEANGSVEAGAPKKESELGAGAPNPPIDDDAGAPNPPLPKGSAAGAGAPQAPPAGAGAGAPKPKGSVAGAGAPKGSAAGAGVPKGSAAGVGAPNDEPKPPVSSPNPELPPANELPKKLSISLKMANQTTPKKMANQFLKLKNTHGVNADITMRLITHNLLRCNAKRVKTGFPLKIVIIKVNRALKFAIRLASQTCSHWCRGLQAAVKKKEFNAEFIKNFLTKVDWPALVGTTILCLNL